MRVGNHRLDIGGRGNWILAGLLVAVMALAIVGQPDYSRPNVEFLPAMRRSPSYEAYEPNPVLPGGTTMQLPPEGTIPRGAEVLHYRATPEDALRAGEELVRPVPAGTQEHQAAIARGRSTFQIYCVPCHGAGGNADGPVVQRGYPPPPSLLTGKSAKMKDGRIFHILTYGQGNMASFAGQLTPAERWDVIHFIRTLQRPPPRPAAAATPAPSESSAVPNASAAPKSAETSETSRSPSKESSP